jgi:L-2,4-diaminobutyric acid acetyltransferase
MPTTGLSRTIAMLAAVRCRPPGRGDAAAAHALVRACPPLDVNSPYAYLLLCTHFAATSVVAEAGGRVVGFAGAYLEPADPSVLFVWQIAVGAEARGLGIGRAMLDELLDRPACRGVTHVEATITPSNASSWNLFRSFAAGRGAACTTTPMFGSADFGTESHEDEHLLRMGPIGTGAPR